MGRPDWLPPRLATQMLSATLERECANSPSGTRRRISRDAHQHATNATLKLLFCWRHSATSMTRCPIVSCTDSIEESNRCRLAGLPPVLTVIRVPARSGSNQWVPVRAVNTRGLSNLVRDQ